MTLDEETEAKLSKPDAKCGRLQRECLKRLLDHRATGALPTSARFIYYELVQLSIVIKKPERPAGEPKGRRSDQDVIDALTHLRENDIVPWAWIVDETRHIRNWRFAATVAKYVIDTVEVARIDVWGGDPPPVIITESRSLAGVLEDLAMEYLVPITATNGQVGGHLRVEVAPRLAAGQRVLYLGDFDWQGGPVEANTRRVLERLVGPLDWIRLAITEEQARGKPVISKPDKRYRPIRYHDAVETEALGQSEIVRIVREHLDSLLPEPLEDVLERERSQHASVASLLRRATRTRS